MAEKRTSETDKASKEWFRFKAEQLRPMVKPDRPPLSTTEYRSGINLDALASRKAFLSGMASTLDLLGQFDWNQYERAFRTANDLATLRRDYLRIAIDCQRSFKKLKSDLPKNLPHQESLFDVDEVDRSA